MSQRGYTLDCLLCAPPENPKGLNLTEMQEHLADAHLGGDRDLMRRALREQTHTTAHGWHYYALPDWAWPHGPKGPNWMRAIPETMLAHPELSRLMAELLTLEGGRRLQVYTWRCDDGRAAFFSVQRALEVIGDREPVQLPLEMIARGPVQFARRNPQLDADHAMRTNVRTPSISVWWDGAYLLIDGNHRVYKALCLGFEWVPMHFLHQGPEADRVCLGVIGPEAVRLLERAGSPLV